MARSTPERAPGAAQVGGLVGDARVIGAIGQAGDRPAAAEEEIRLAGIADRPAAGFLGELEQGPALTHGNDVVDQFRLGVGVEGIGMGERGIAAHGRPRNPHHMLMRAGLARPWRRRGRRFGAARKPKPVHLADHGMTGKAAKLGRDLAGRQPVGPKPLQRLDAFISPAHGLKSLASRGGEVRTESDYGRGTDALPPTPTATTMYASDLSAARYVVPADRKATIWRESGARVRAPGVHMFIHLPALHPHLSTGPGGARASRAAASRAVSC